MRDDHAAINEAWILLKQYHDTQDSDEYWQGLIHDVSEFESKKEAGDLREQLARAILNVLDDRHKKKREVK